MDSITSPPAPPSAPPSDAGLDRLLRLIIEGFFVLTDGQGHLSKWSDPAEMLFGHEADDALMEPFFGKLVSTSQLSPQAEAWRAFLETGDTPGPAGTVRVEANRVGGGESGTFTMETVFIPVKLDEGFDFSLFLEDLGFELPIEMMLLRMRQQHPVVVRALRSALEATPQPWDGVRTAGTLVAFHALEPTPWMDEAWERRRAEQAEAEAELQSRIEMLEAPEVQGTDVYDLDDARAVIDRLRWATERIGELEERSRVADDAVAQAADARVRAEAAERAALDVRAEVSGVLAARPVDSSGEADRLELIARVDRVERAATDAAEAAAASRNALEAERARSQDLEVQRAELLARLEQVEAAAGSTSVAEAAVADARAELTARMEALERTGAGGAAASAELVGRLEALERARTAEAAELREEIERVRSTSDVRSDLETLQEQVAETARLHEEILTLRERADAASAVMRRGEERESAAHFDAQAARSELAAALQRVEQLSEETARIRAHLESRPADAGLSSDDRHKLELAASGVIETRTGLEAIRFLSEELRLQSAELRDEGGRLTHRLNELADTDHHAWQEREGLRRDQDELRVHLDELRSEREELKAQLRETARAAEEARTLAEREPTASGIHAPPASQDELLVARQRLDELALQIEAAEQTADETRSELTGVRGEVSAIGESADEARRLAREAGDRVDMVDRANQTALAQVSTQAAIIEEIGALARVAQADAGESRADAGEAVAAIARLEQTVIAAREQVETAVAEAAVAREQAAAAGETASGVRSLMSGVGEAAREAVAPLATELADVTVQLDAVNAAIAALQERPAGADPEVDGAVEALRADVRALRTAMESAEGGDAAAVQTLTARIDSVEEDLPRGIDARMESLRDGLSTALGKLESVSAEMAATRSETGAGREVVEQRLADSAAELMAARTDAEQARRGLEGLQHEVATLREYAASAKAEAEAAREAVATARKAGSADDRAVAELRTEVASALAKLGEFKGGFEEARQAAVAARREAEQARAAAEKAGAVNEATGEKFTQVWQKMLTSAPAAAPSPRRPGSGVGSLGRAAVSKPKEAPPIREPREGFDDDPRPMAVLDLKGKFKQLNPGFCKLVGYQEHQFAKATWPSVLDRKVYAEQKGELDAMAAGERDASTVDSTFMHGQGLMVLIKGEVFLQRDEAGEPDHLLMIAEQGTTG